eukprot:UN31550
MRMEDEITEHIGDHALDNARIYSYMPLNADELSWEARQEFELYYAEDKKIIFKMGNKKMLDQVPAQFQQQICSVFLREIARKCKFTRMGRNLYDPNSRDRRVD